MKYLLIFAFAIAPVVVGFSQSHILSQREQAEVVDQWLNEKLETVLPELMRREGIDMWFIVSREYNEDPVIRTLLPATWHAARRRTMLLVYDPGEGQDIETLAVARYDVGEAFKKAWDPESEPDQWKRLAELIQERSPQRIGVNKAENYGHADGINATEYELLKEYLPEEYHERIVSAENLAVGWLETRTPAEMATYRHIVGLAHEIIAEGLSEKVITPGITTTDDVVWWYRERIKELKLDTWFHPTVDIQRAESEKSLKSFSSRPESQVILPGDLLHMDFGITYLRLNTDTQQLAYVLKPGETQVPEYLNEALKVGNRLQDILTGEFQTGRSGNEILRRSREVAERESIRASIYTHPIGYHGHAAGPTIGMWDNQDDTPGSGDYPLYPNTAFSIELNATVFLEEWGQDVRIMLEEEAYFDGERVVYINGRQKEILAIPRHSGHLAP
jgi:Xaa-Pro aminopeptidase